MKKFTFEAETKIDFDKLLEIWIHALRKEGFKKTILNWCMKTNNDAYFCTSDVDVEIETDATEKEIVSLMERVDDGHKMIRTLKEK